MENVEAQNKDSSPLQTQERTPMRPEKSFLAALTLAALLLAGCTGKVAVINPDLIFQDSNAAKSGLAYLTGLSQELQAEISSPPENAARRRAPEADLQRRINEAQMRYNTEQQQVMGRINSLFREALEACRLKGRFSVVIVSEAALAHDPAMDITRMVVEEMNKTPLSFSPQPSRDGEEASPAAQ
jgi:Skp family chaperone for outer membrane proteins